MEQYQKTNIGNDFNLKYKFPLERISESLHIQRLLSEVETPAQFRQRVRSELGAVYGSNLLLRHRSVWTEAAFQGVSIRSIQRYQHEFPLSDTFLDLIYNIQISQMS